MILNSETLIIQEEGNALQKVSLRIVSRKIINDNIYLLSSLK